MARCWIFRTPDLAPFESLGAPYIDNIQTRFTGVFNAPADGLYSFGTQSDDGSVIFIDGESVVNNNRYQGQTRRDGTATLTAGAHQIEIGFYERGGGAGITVYYTPPGGFDQIMDDSVLFQRLGAAIYDNPITASGGTIDVSGFGAVVPDLTVVSGSTLGTTGNPLTVNALNIGATSTFNVSNETTVLGINDGGAAVTINKTGSGDLVLDDPATPQLQNNASIINIQQGAIGVVLAGGNQGTGNATLQFNGGGLVLSSKDGLDKNYTAPNFAAGGVFAARQIGSGMAGTPGTPIAINVTNGFNVDAGNTLQLSTADDYVINVGGTGTGAGNIAIGSGVINASTGTALQPYGILFNGVNGANPTAPGTLNIKANNASLRSLASASGSAGSMLVIGDGAAPATLTLTGPAAGETARFTNTIEENGQPVSVVANGAGTQTLEAVNGFTGGLTVNSGIVELGADGAAGTGPITLNGGALQFGAYGLLLNIYNVAPDPAAYSGVLNTLPTALDYYNALPNLEISTLTSADGNNFINYLGGDPGAPFAIHGSTIGDNVQAIMTGQVQAPVDGVYNFAANSDDGSLIYIDGQLLVNNNGLHGDTKIGADVTLTAGYHDIAIMYNEQGGGANLTVFYTLPGGSEQILPNGPADNPILRTTAYSAVNTVLVTADSTLNLRDGLVNLGILTQTTGTTLTMTSGRVNFPEALMSDGGAYTYAGAGSIALGQITDGGGAVTINRTGGGNLVLASPAAAQLQNSSSVINVSGGSLVVGVFGGANDPFGSASININGGGIGLSTVDSFGTIDYTRPISVTGSGILSAGNFGGGAASGDPLFPIPTTVTQAPTVTAGNTLTVNSNSGYQLILGAGASGAGGLTASGGDVVTNGPVTMGESVNVTGGVLTNNAALTADQINISTSGVLNANGAITATTGTSIASKGRLDLNGQAYSGGPIAINEGSLRAVSGVNDLTGIAINIAPTVETPTPNALQGAFYHRVDLSITTADGVNNAIPNAQPDSLTAITGAIDYPAGLRWSLLRHLWRR